MKYISIIIFILYTNFGTTQSESKQIQFEDRKMSFSELINELENNFDVNFNYASESIEGRNVNLENKKYNLNEILSIIGDQNQWEHKKIGNNVLLRPSEEPILKKEDKTFRIHGRVMQDIDSTALQLAAISINNSSIGTFSDDDGNFFIDIPEEYIDQKLIVHYLGYEDAEYEIRELKDQFVLVPLKFGTFSIDEILIVNSEKAIKISDQLNAIDLSKIDMLDQKASIAGQDILRQVQLLPGVAAFDDTSSEIKIRGSNADQTLIILDDMPLYHTDHYYGMFSSINASYVNRIRLYKNYFPLEYGGKTAGVLEMKSDDEIPENVNGKLEANLLNTSGYLDIPLSQNIKLSLAGRTTWQNVSNSQFNSFAEETPGALLVNSLEGDQINGNSSPDFKFWDFNSKVQFEINENTSLSLNAFLSRDFMDNRAFQQLRDNKDKEVKLNLSEQEEWQNNAASLSLKTKLGGNTHWHNAVYYTRYENLYHNELKVEHNPDLNGPTPNCPDPEKKIRRGSQFNQITDLGLNSYLHFVTEKWNWKIGASAISHQIDFDFEENSNSIFLGKDEFFEGSLFSSIEYALTEKLRLNGGMRSTYYQPTNSVYFSPRAMLTYQIHDHFKLKGSYSYYQQFIREIEFDYRGITKELWVNAKHSIPVLNSHNYMLGASFLNDYFSIDVELFRKNMDGLLEFTAIRPGDQPENNQSREYDLFKGNGYTHGVDVLINSQIRNYETYISYTLSKSEERYQEIDKNNYFPAENDRRHQLKWLNSYNLNKFVIGLDWIYTSGRPYVDIRSLGQNGDIRNSSKKDRFRYLDPYHRWDVSIAYKFKILNKDARLTASVLNVFNNKNVKYIQSVHSTFEDQNGPGQNQLINTIVGNESQLLGRTLNVSASISF